MSLNPEEVDVNVLISPKEKVGLQKVCSVSKVLICKIGIHPRQCSGDRSLGKIKENLRNFRNVLKMHSTGKESSSERRMDPGRFPESQKCSIL